MIFRCRGGQFGVANMHGCSIIHGILAVQCIATGDYKCRITYSITLTVMRGDRQRDAPAHIHLCSFQRFVVIIRRYLHWIASRGGNRYRNLLL